MEFGKDFIIRVISPSDNIKPFSTGSEAFAPLKAFLKNEAVNFQQAMVAQTWAAIECDNGIDTGKVIGYITLTCSEVDLCGNVYSLDDCPSASNYDWLPALKIARLAVDRRYRGKGIGIDFIGLALNISIESVATMAGCRFLITDAKKESIPFYEKAGFTILDSDENRSTEHPVMFIDLLKSLNSFCGSESTNDDIEFIESN